MGCRQAVRHWTLTPTLRRFESYHPSQYCQRNFGFVAGLKSLWLLQNKVLPILRCVGSTHRQESGSGLAVAMQPETNPTTPAKQKICTMAHFCHKCQKTSLFVWFFAKSPPNENCISLAVLRWLINKKMEQWKRLAKMGDVKFIK